jgi:uncharacterized Zn-binding protein involved in type VI secretion
VAGISRNGDTAGGVMSNTQSTVSVNGSKVIVDGDPVAVHGIFPHIAQVVNSTNQSSVKIGGVKVVVIGDPASICGEPATGSNNVSIGS